MRGEKGAVEYTGTATGVGDATVALFEVFREARSQRAPTVSHRALQDVAGRGSPFHTECQDGAYRGPLRACLPDTRDSWHGQGREEAESYLLIKELDVVAGADAVTRVQDCPSPASLWLQYWKIPTPRTFDGYREKFDPNRTRLGRYWKDLLLSPGSLSTSPRLTEPRTSNMVTSEEPLHLAHLGEQSCASTRPSSQRLARRSARPIPVRRRNSPTRYSVLHTLSVLHTHVLHSWRPETASCVDSAVHGPSVWSAYWRLCLWTPAGSSPL